MDDTASAATLRETGAPPHEPGPEEGYYGRAAVKPSLYGWTVALYIFAGGLAGAAQIVATAVDLTVASEPALTVVTIGRALALAGAVAGGVLLIADLHTRRRFYNMLRIFRATSPMSIGTYVLMGFGFFSLVALGADLYGAGLVATLGGVLAALFGLPMTAYTAPLLSATSTPLWAASPRTLACRFVASSFAAGAAAMLIAAWAAGGTEVVRPLVLLATGALIVDLAASVAAEARYRALDLDAPLRAPPWGPVHRLGVQIAGLVAPLILYLYALGGGAGATAAAMAASLLAVAGSVLMRGVVLHAGNASAARPADYFRFARADARQARG